MRAMGWRLPPTNGPTGSPVLPQVAMLWWCVGTSLSMPQGMRGPQEVPVPLPCWWDPMPRWCWREVGVLGPWGC